MDNKIVSALLPRISVMDAKNYTQKYIEIERKGYHTLLESYICTKKHENLFEAKMLEGEESYRYLLNKFENRNRMKQARHRATACPEVLNYGIDNIDQNESS